MSDTISDELRFFAPTIEDMQQHLTEEQIGQFQSLAESLEVSFSPTPSDFNLAGWVWIQIAQARDNDSPPVDAESFSKRLNESYLELLKHLMT